MAGEEEQARASEELLAANARFVAAEPPDPRSGRPARQLAVLTCMDCRIDPAAAFGLDAGDAHVLRNAGGLVTPDVLRSLAISQRALGTTEIAIIGHTGCGMSGFDDAAFRSGLSADSDRTPDWDVPGFSDVTAAVAQSVARVRDCDWLPNRESVTGFVYDVGTGQLSRV